MWLYLAALALIGVIIVVLVGSWKGAHPPAEETPGTPDDVEELLSRASEEGRRLTAEDLGAVRLRPAVRGYRMDQVDRLIDALQAQLEQAQRP